MLPPFNAEGDLPVGIYRVSLNEVIQHFGSMTAKRRQVCQSLVRIHALARGTGFLDRFIIFGSFVTTKPGPNDIDIVLVMRDDFKLGACFDETRWLFYHDKAHTEFGASVFWVRPSMLVVDTLDEFISHWQHKRDLTRRGIVEVVE